MINIKNNLKRKLKNMQTYGSFRNPKYRYTLVFKDMYGKMRREVIYSSEKPRGKTQRIDHNIIAKIVGLKKL